MCVLAIHVQCDCCSHSVYVVASVCVVSVLCICCMNTVFLLYLCLCCLSVVAMDVSADLTELGRTPVTVISSGVKSILDIKKTLEYLVSY